MFGQCRRSCLQEFRNDEIESSLNSQSGCYRTVLAVLPSRFLSNSYTLKHRGQQLYALLHIAVRWVCHSGARLLTVLDTLLRGISGPNRKEVTR
jgi:hypothetical protein